jgi:hypothetical protein
VLHLTATLLLPVVQLHMLLHLEELQQEVDVRSYDMKDAQLLVSGRYLGLKVSSINRHRTPLLGCWGKAYACNPWAPLLVTSMMHSHFQQHVSVGTSLYHFGCVWKPCGLTAACSDSTTRFKE